MRKILFLMMALGTIATAKTAVEVRIGGDLSSDGKFKEVYNYIDGKIKVPEQSNPIKSGYELAGEIRTGDNLEFGVGIAYRGHKLKGLENVFSSNNLPKCIAYVPYTYGLLPQLFLAISLLDIPQSQQKCPAADLFPM